MEPDSLWEVTKGVGNGGQANGKRIDIDGHLDHRTEAEGYYTHTDATSKFRQVKSCFMYVLLKAQHPL